MSAGLDGLLAQTAQARMIDGQKQSQKYPAGKCGRVFIPLCGWDLYCDSPTMGATQLGLLMVGGIYSEVRDEKGTVVAIKKHEALQIVGTGILTETVDVPKWWDKREAGIP